MRNWQIPLTALAVVTLLGGAWIGWIIGRASPPSAFNCIAMATSLNLVVRCFSHYAAAASLGRARRDGSYELLLTSPLYPSEIVRGQIEALRRQFLGVTLAVLSIDLVMMILAARGRTWDIPVVLVYLCVWGGILFWTWEQNRNQRGALLSMWISLNCARPLFAVCRSFGFDSGASLVWLILLPVTFQDRWLQEFPDGSLGEVVIIAGAILLLIVALRGRFRESALYLERRLVLDFRDIAREPVPDPADPRFKHWLVRERFSRDSGGAWTSGAWSDR